VGVALIFDNQSLSFNVLILFFTKSPDYMIISVTIIVKICTLRARCSAGRLGH